MPFLLRRKWMGQTHYCIDYADAPRSRLNSDRGECAVRVTERQAKMGPGTLGQMLEQGLLAK